MKLIGTKLFLDETEVIDQSVLRALEKEANRIAAQIQVFSVTGHRSMVISPTLSRHLWDDTESISRQLVNGPVTELSDSNAEAVFWNRGKR